MLNTKKPLTSFRLIGKSNSHEKNIENTEYTII
jgi:hypothetical protein